MYVDAAKYLGVIIDSKLTFNSHISTVVMKLLKNLLKNLKPQGLAGYQPDC